jgi:hypothetical protein
VDRLELPVKADEAHVGVRGGDAFQQIGVEAADLEDELARDRAAVREPLAPAAAAGERVRGLDGEVAEGGERAGVVAAGRRHARIIRDRPRAAPRLRR